MGSGGVALETLVNDIAGKQPPRGNLPLKRPPRTITYAAFAQADGFDANGAWGYGTNTNLNSAITQASQACQSKSNTSCGDQGYCALRSGKWGAWASDGQVAGNTGMSCNVATEREGARQCASLVRRRLQRALGRGGPMTLHRKLYEGRKTWIIVTGALLIGWGTAAQSSEPSRRVTAEKKSVTEVSPNDDYDVLLHRATVLLQRKSPKATDLLRRAVLLDGSRYEAHILYAAALRQQGQYGAAVVHLQTASDLAPVEIQPTLTRAIAEARIAALPGDARRKLDALMLIAQDANEATGAARAGFMREFMMRTTAFLDNYDFVYPLWVLRAEMALELNYSSIGWEAGYQLRVQGIMDEDTPSIRQLLARMERRNWLGDQPLTPQIFETDLQQFANDPRDDGDAALAYALGVALFFGQNGLAHDPVKALHWFRVAAEQGDVLAYKALNASPDPAETKQYLLRAVRGGLPSSYTLLGMDYLNGASGWPHDENAALYWIRKGADAGDSNAMLDLANTLLGGQSAPKDEIEGLSWTRKAADAGIPAAALNLAQYYRSGAFGLAADATEAMRWYRDAAAGFERVFDLANEELACLGASDRSRFAIPRW